MNIKRLFHQSCLAVAAVLAMAFTSCGMMDYEGPDCSTQRRIRFTYDWNMLWADAFPHEVKTLTLYAFDKSGTLVYKRFASTDSIIQKGYMDLSDLPAGVYDLQVWAEGEQRNANSYQKGNIEVGDSLRDSLRIRLNRDSNGDIRQDITPLYYGTLNDADFTDMGKEGGVREVTVNLMKDTENFRIVLQNLGGQPLPVDSFTFTITDNNGYLAADNALLPDQKLTYHAWSVLSGVVTSDSITTSPNTITSTSAVVAELTTNRLVEGHNTRLVVTRNYDGHRIIDIPLIDACLLVKGNYNRDLSNQEYLDRQDAWNLIFIMDSNLNWLAGQLYVQQWRLVWQSHDINL